MTSTGFKKAARLIILFFLVVTFAAYVVWLSVYLRMLDVPVSVIHGRSADENSFG